MDYSGETRHMMLFANYHRESEKHNALAQRHLKLHYTYLVVTTVLDVVSYMTLFPPLLLLNVLCKFITPLICVAGVINNASGSDHGNYPLSDAKNSEFWSFKSITSFLDFAMFLSGFGSFEAPYSATFIMLYALVKVSLVELLGHKSLQEVCALEDNPGLRFGFE